MVRLDLTYPRGRPVSFSLGVCFWLGFVNLEEAQMSAFSFPMSDFSSTAQRLNNSTSQLLLLHDFSGQAVDLNFRDRLIAGFRETDDPDGMSLGRF
jgi:hypothetical protein